MRRAAAPAEDRVPARGLLLVLLLLVLVPVGFVLGIVLLASMLAGASQSACSPAGTGPLPADFGGPGTLGGVGGTGISRPLVENVRVRSLYAGPRVTPGPYVSTAYGPPWGGIQGAGIATSGGLPIARGAPRWYMVAADPAFTVEVSAAPIAATGGRAPSTGTVQPGAQGSGSIACDGLALESLVALGPKGQVVFASGADRAGTPTQQPVLDFLARVAGIAERELVVTTGTNHSQFTSSGNVSDHWVGLAADLGSVANGYAMNGEGGTLIAAASLHAAVGG